MVTVKRCHKCGKEKPLEDFARRSAAKDGHQGQCKECVRSYCREWGQRNREKVSANKRRWYEENKATQARHRAEYKARHPEKVAARAAINNAIYAGRLVKPSTCSECGRSFPSRLLHAHHEDYCKPFAVEWLCRDCHWSQHRAIEFTSREP